MSLLDDVSIVVTPNGYKAGELYAVVPVPSEGAELVVNGDFATDTNWTKGTGWTISGGTANSDGTQTGNSNLYQAPFYVAGKRYKTTLTVNSISGTLKVFTGTSIQSLTITSAGDYEVIALSSSTTLYLQVTASTTVEVDNVSVKEYTSADMDVTRATAATRVDEDGLVNYAEIIGSEEVANGDFESGTSGWTTSGGWSITDKATNSGSGGQIYPVSNSWKSGVTVRFSLTVSNRTTGHIRIQNPSVSVYYENNINTNNSFVFEFTTVDLAGWKIEAVSGFDGSIDNVSVKEVTRDNVPRIDYTGGGCPHILAEPQRTNIVTYSEDFSEWGTQDKIILTPNSVSSPSGDVNAYKIIPTSTSGVHKLRENLSTVSGDYTLSIFAKQGEYKNILLWDDTLSGGLGVNLNDLSIFRNQNNQSYNIEDYGSGWVRISVTLSYSSQQILPSLYIYDNSATPQIIFAGNDIDGLYIWGAQVEEGSYPTSYIPTSGSTVTRNQDIFTRDGIGSLINSEEGVLFVEMAALSDELTYRCLTISDGTNNNRIIIRYGNTSNILQALCYTPAGLSGYTQYTLTDETSFSKIAFKYKLNDFALWIDGNEVGTSSGVVPTGLNTLDFASASDTQHFYGKVKQLQVYKTADIDLAALTS